MSLVLPSNLKIEAVGVEFTETENDLLKSSNIYLNDGIIQVYNLSQSLKRLKSSNDSDPAQFLSNLTYQKQILDNLGHNIEETRTKAGYCCEEILKAHKPNEDRIKANEREISSFKSQSVYLESTIYNLNRTLESKQKEYDNKKQKLETFKKDNEDYLKAQAVVGVVGVGIQLGAFLIPVVGPFIAFGASVSTLTIMGIQQAYKKSEKELNDLQYDMNNIQPDITRNRNELQDVQRKLNENERQQAAIQATLNNDKKKSYIFGKVVYILEILQSGIKDWESVIDQIIFDLRLKLTTCQIPRNAERDNNNFLNSIRQTLEENQYLFDEFEEFQSQLVSSVRSINAPQ